MVYQGVLPYLGRFAMGFAVGFPIAVTFVENVGSVKGVQGISMQVGCQCFGHRGAFCIGKWRWQFILRFPDTGSSLF